MAQAATKLKGGADLGHTTSGYYPVTVTITPIVGNSSGTNVYGPGATTYSQAYVDEAPLQQ